MSFLDDMEHLDELLELKTKCDAKVCLLLLKEGNKTTDENAKLATEVLQTTLNIIKHLQSVGLIPQDSSESESD